MSDGNLHEVSMVLGKLVNASEDATRTREMIFQKLDNINSCLLSVSTNLKAVTENHAELSAKVENHVMPAVEEIKGIKQKGIGVLVGIGLLAGGAGSTITKLTTLFQK